MTTHQITKKTWSLDVIEMDRMVLRETLNDYASIDEEDLLECY